MEHSIPFAGQRVADNKTIRIDIRRGHFYQWLGRDVPPKEYDYVQGRLVGIALRKRATPNGETTFVDLKFACGDTRFEVSALASSSISAELISKVVNIQDPASVIRIDVWPKENYTNCTVRENGQKLPFRILPKVERRQNGFKTDVDSSERDAAVMRLIVELNGRLGATGASNKA